MTGIDGGLTLEGGELLGKSISEIPGWKPSRKKTKLRIGGLW
jgi:hypothetical protein